MFDVGHVDVELFFGVRHWKEEKYGRGRRMVIEWGRGDVEQG